MKPDTGMVLAAGKGTRMAPLTNTRPKPLVALAGKPLIDHALARLKVANISKTIVNIHYLADMLESHLQSLNDMEILISDERAELLETGGGVKKALGLIGDKAFYLLNSDSIWWEKTNPALDRLADALDEAAMDILLLVVPLAQSSGYCGRGDFLLGPDGRLSRLSDTGAGEGLVYMGTAILHPRIFVDAPDGAFSLNLLFDRAIKSGRLYGLVHEGNWMHVGTPGAIGEAEEQLRTLGAESTTTS